MNSDYEQRSLEELKARHQQMAQAAEQTTPAVLVSQENWHGVIELLKLQFALQKKLQTCVLTLATRKDLADSLEGQAEHLTQFAVESKRMTKEFQSRLAEEAQRISQQTEQAMQEMEQQAGRLSEQFSSALSETRSLMKQLTRRLILVSLIPSAMLLALESALHIWPLT